MDIFKKSKMSKFEKWVSNLVKKNLKPLLTENIKLFVYYASVKLLWIRLYIMLNMCYHKYGILKKN